MNNHQAVLRALTWRDFRLVWPMAVMLVVVAIFLLMVWSVLPVTSGLTAAIGSQIPVLLPALFAAGAGALLIGQEKEQGTMAWVASLPVPPRSIIASKLAVALAGLAVMWAGGFALSLVVAAPQSTTGFSLPSVDRPFSTEGAFWILHSVFLLLAGFLTAWIFQNVFVSLIAIVPLACVPYVLVHVWLAITGGDEKSYGPPMEDAPVASVIIAIVSVAVTAWLACRVASTRLQPVRPPRHSSSAVWREAWRPSGVALTRKEPFRFSLSSLVWQSLHHNPVALAGLTAATLISVVSLALLGRAELLNDYGGLLIFGGFLGWLAVSWLGVFAFTGDGSAERLRFLADRGVAPTLAWLGRQTIGVGLISLAVLLYAALSLAVVSTEQPDEAFVLSVAMVALMAAIAYSFSQAISHWVRILAASAFLAPVLSGAAAWWLVFAAVEMGAPVWLLVLTTCLPLVATWLTMRTFMDGGPVWSIVAAAGAVGLLVVVLPAVPLAIRVARFPSMPDSMRQELTAAAAEASAAAPTPVPITLAVTDEDENSFRLGLIPVEEAVEQINSQPVDPREWLRLGNEPANGSGAATIDYFVLRRATGRATLEKLEVLAAGGGADERSSESLMQWIDTLTQMADRLRRSPRWVDQESADVIEIWLTQTLSDPVVELDRGSETYRSAVELLSDRERRNEARRRAVLTSWHEFRQSRESDALGSLVGRMSHLHAFYERSAVERMLLVNRYGDAFVAAAIELLDRAAAGESTEAPRRRLHHLVFGATTPFETGPYSPRLRGGKGLPPSISDYQTLRCPANQWDAGWERVAASLAR